MDIKQKINTLRQDINNWNYQYYVLTQPIVSDFEFDQKLKELEKLESQYPEYYDYYSPTQRIGSDINNAFVQVTHTYPMLSISNTYSKDGINDFCKKIKKILCENFVIVCELKYDGVSISLLYKNGLLWRAVTRGDGTIGDDVTVNIRTVKSIPLKLRDTGFPNIFEIRGEIILPWMTFNKINSDRIKNDKNPFSNPRNAAAGTLKTLDPNAVFRRNLDAYLYNLLCENLPSDSHYENLQFSKDWGFKISNDMKCCKTINDIFDFIDYWDKERKNLSFSIDGIVLKVDSIRQQSLLGERARSPRWAIAYKFQTKAVKTVLHSVDFQIGKTGIVTPVANLNPVLLSGTVIKRASLYNEDIINSFDLHIGDQCYVEKGGEIIPKIIGVNKKICYNKNNKVSFPKKCPSCGAPLIRFLDGTAYYCPNNTKCESQIKGMIIHFVSRKAMNINIGEEAIETFYKAGLVHNVADLYEIKLDNILELKRWGERSAVNFIKSVQQSKKKPYERVLYGLGIRFVGETASKKLVKVFPTIEQLSMAKKEQLIAINDIGERIAQSVIQYFNNKNNLQLIRRLKFHKLQMSHDCKSVIGNKLKGKIFVLSGLFRNYSRDEYKSLIETNGGKNVFSISSKTDFILAGDNMSQIKLEKARRFGTKIISENEFLVMIKQQNMLNTIF
ncbi:MAG: NAD-dependent DNA ligase LigA [Bacteroidales bacterium OttesenSCG-928-I14]|jgi:DNA ligase (NAD+)|nr:NAD-dependent DNA ligase LigA [Bacteroidales bacterium OttesenSCG-928-I14]